MDNLEYTASKRDKKWKDLEETIIKLVQEHYRLQGKPYYEPAIPDLEAVIQGEG